MTASEKLVKRIVEECGVELYEIRQRPTLWRKKDAYTIAWDGDCRHKDLPGRYVHIYSHENMTALLKAKRIVATLRNDPHTGYPEVYVRGVNDTTTQN